MKQDMPKQPNSRTTQTQPGVSVDSHGWITPPSGRVRLGLLEVIKRYELVGVMIWREILLRYKQTLVGWGWVVIQPVITMVVFAIVFHRAMNVSTEVPYIPFALSGLVIWIYFNHAITKGSVSIIHSHIILKKVNFPRLVLPLAAVMGGLLDFLIMLLLLVIVMVFYHIPITLNFLFWPFFLIITVLAALGLSFWLSAINTRYHDVNNLLPFLMQTGLFVTPIGYPLHHIPAEWHRLIAINPLVGAIEGFRWATLGAQPPALSVVLISVAVSLFLFVSGLYHFKKKEPHFGDLI